MNVWDNKGKLIEFVRLPKWVRTAFKCSIVSFQEQLIFELFDPEFSVILTALIQFDDATFINQGFMVFQPWKTALGSDKCLSSEKLLSWANLSLLIVVLIVDSLCYFSEESLLGEDILILPIYS